MRAILWGINYAPEPIGIAPFQTGLAEHLRGRGFDVSVVAGFPYYPAWRKAEADRGRLFRRDVVNGVTVHRCWQYVPSRPGTVRRMAHELSFVATSLWRMLWLPRPDLYVVLSPPLGLGLAAAVVSWLKRRPYLFHVQDLQPDSANELGMVRPGLFLRLLYACERFAYRHASGVGGVSPGMVTAFRDKGVPREKIFLLPNWRRASHAPQATPEAAAQFRARHGVGANDFLAVYSGNLGRKQGLDVILDAAELIAAAPAESRAIVLLVAGDGAAQPGLARRLRARPQANVRLLPLQSEADHAAMLRAADVALITQAPGTGRACFPSKLLSVLAAGLPVIATADEASDLALAVQEGRFGRRLPAGDAAALSRTLRAAVRYPQLVERWCARTAWVERYAADVVLDRFETVIQKLAHREPSRPRATLAPVPGRDEG